MLLNFFKSPILFLIFTSCIIADKNKVDVKDDIPIKEISITKVQYNYKERDYIPLKEQQETIIGYYVGKVEIIKNECDLKLSNNDTILICIDTIYDKKAFGYYTFEGNKETFEGSFNNYIDTTNINYQYDGIFEYIVLAKKTDSIEKVRELKFIIEIGKDPPNKIRDNSQYIRGNYLTFTKNLDSSEINYNLSKTFYLHSPFLSIPEDYDWSQHDIK
jgi:hypothetical protein